MHCIGISCWIFHSWKAVGFSIRNLVDLCYFNKVAFSFSPSPVLTQLVWKWMEWTSSCSTRVSCMTFQVPLSSSGLIKHYSTQQPSSSLLFPLGFAVQSYMPKANFATQTIIAKIKMHLIKNFLWRKTTPCQINFSTRVWKIERSFKKLLLWLWPSHLFYYCLQ